MRILLVDDEIRVLEGLERMLMHVALPDWEIRCAQSGDEALAILDAEPADIVLSDLRMPGMQGAALLGIVHQRYPGVIRLVLSGEMDEQSAMRLVPHAHQFLAKPCSATALHDLFTRALALRDGLDDDAMRRMIGDLDSLPVLPATYAELTSLLADPNCSARKVADVVRRDPALAAKMLQLVNSAFFGRGTRVIDIDAAVVRLGIGTIKALALTVGAFRPLGDAACSEIVARAVEAGAIARQLGGGLAEEAFLAALLHDVGEAALCASAPDRFAKVLAQARRENRPRHEVEIEHGIDHARVGAYLLGLWGLPPPIVEAVALHHDAPRWVHEPRCGLVEIVYVAAARAEGRLPDEAIARVVDAGAA